MSEFASAEQCPFCHHPGPHKRIETETDILIWCSHCHRVHQLCDTAPLADVTAVRVPCTG